MGTRGLCGFRINGKDKLSYNHYDSSPDYLGEEVVKFCRSIKNIQDLKDKVTNIKLVDEEGSPTPEEKEFFKNFGSCNFNVSEKSEDDWYCLLRENQGDIEKMLECGIMIDIDILPRLKSWDS